MFAEKDTAKSIHCRFMNGGCRLPSDEEFQPEFGMFYHDWSCCTLLITLKVTVMSVLLYFCTPF